MKKSIVFMALSFVAATASAANDVYGSVSEIITRSGESGDTSLYIRLDVIHEYSNFENCVRDKDTLVWHVDLSSPVAAYQYDIIQQSYTEQLPVRVIGYDDVCSKGKTYSDKIYELSPWAWDSHTANNK